MDLKQFRQLLVLAQTLNFRKAAVLLNMTQPPLSVSIQHLEEELGVKLFDRTSSGLRLTVPGKDVLDHARRALFHAEQFRLAAQQSLAGNIGTLRVDFVASSTIWLLPQTISRFRQAYPNVELQLNEANTDAIMTSLKDGRTDVGLVRYPTPNFANVSMSPIERNHYVVALPVGHSKAGRARLRLADLKDEPFIFPSKVATSTAYSSALLACQQAGFMPRIVQEGAHAQTIVSLVESGLGIALVPNVWEDLAHRSVTFKKLFGMTPCEIGLGFAFRTDEQSSPLIASFQQAALVSVRPEPRLLHPAVARRAR